MALALSCSGGTPKLPTKPAAPATETAEEEQMLPGVPSQSIDGNEELLQHLAARLFTAPEGLWPRVTRAKAIVRGSVTRSEVIAHPPGKSFLADPELRELAPDGPGGRQLFISVVEVTTERWISGTGGAIATGIWLSPETVTSETVTLPLVGSAGIVLLERLPATALGRELGQAVPGAYAIAPLRPIVLPDDDGELTTALDLVRSEPPSAATLAQALSLHGGGLHVVLGVAVRAHTDGVVSALRARVIAGSDDADTLLVRAALARLGEREAALAGLDSNRIKAEVLQALGIIALDKDTVRLGLVGPTVTTPLPW